MRSTPTTPEETDLDGGAEWPQFACRVFDPHRVLGFACRAGALGVAPTSTGGSRCTEPCLPQQISACSWSSRYVSGSTLTYRDATCAAVADIVTTSESSDGVRAVTNYVVSRGYDPYVGKDIALHNC